jgi:hypothetical protein
MNSEARHCGERVAGAHATSAWPGAWPATSAWPERARGRSLSPTADPKPALWTKDDEIFTGLDLGEVEQILGPGPRNVLYPAETLERCACGWAHAGACFVHRLACDNGTAALRAAPADTFLERDMRTWEELCGQEARKYTTRKAPLLVLHVLRRDSEREDAAPAWVAECDATFASMAWGLLDPEDETDWYSGEPSAGGAWRFDARRLATYGPGGLRLGLLGLNAPHKLRTHAALFNLGGDLRDNFIVPVDGETSEDYAHTIAQLVCRDSLEGYLLQPLDEYFADVLLPMSHSVQLGAGAACGRWAVEASIREAFRRSDLATDAGREQAAIQAEVADVWEARCVASAHSAGICAMRGVYDAVSQPQELLHPPVSWPHPMLPAAPSDDRASAPAVPPSSRAVPGPSLGMTYSMHQCSTTTSESMSQSLKKTFITTVLTAVKKNKQPTHTPGGPGRLRSWSGQVDPEFQGRLRFS